MKTRPFADIATAAALALALSSCDLATDPPPQHLVDVVMDFCSNDNPIWFAYQNQNGPVVVLPTNLQGTYSFTANNRVALAFVRQNGADYHTEIVFTTSFELEVITGQVCLEESGVKSLNGSVAGIATGQIGVVGMNFSSVILPGNQPFSLTQLADRPLDLVASRQALSSTVQLADRIIIRRAVPSSSGATMPVLDFFGTEFFSALTPTATVNGVSGDDEALLQNNFLTGLGTSHTLSAVVGISNGPTSYAAVPLGSQITGDYHDIFVLAVDANASVRGVERFFRNPLDQSLTLGPVLSTPTVTTVATSPYLRLRAHLPLQLPYTGAITIAYRQLHGSFSVTTVTLTGSGGYFASLASWDVDIPNLSDEEGWLDAWGLQSGGGTVDWTVTAYASRPELLLGASPIDGETIAFASRSSSTSAMVAQREGRPTALRQRPFSRAR